MITVTVQYFAAFRERAGFDREQVATTARTSGELFAELAERHGFADPIGRCKVAVNEELADWQIALTEGDEILFFPPVAGG
jgi:molybdopterin synthase sulfur carrier subunit